MLIENDLVLWMKYKMIKIKENIYQTPPNLEERFEFKSWNKRSCQRNM